MYLLDSVTRFFAVVGAPYIPEGHLDGYCDEARRPRAVAAEAERECPQDQATAWWPRTCH